MTWYAVHISMLVSFKDGRQDSFPVWENICLVNATDRSEARSKAEKLARDEYEGDDDGSFTWNERPATWVFSGVRRLIECVDSDLPPKEGTEVTYLEFDIGTRNEYDRYISGQDAELIYRK